MDYKLIFTVLCIAFMVIGLIKKTIKLAIIAIIAYVIYAGINSMGILPKEYSSLEGIRKNVIEKQINQQTDKAKKEVKTQVDKTIQKTQKQIEKEVKKEVKTQVKAATKNKLQKNNK